MYDSKRIASGVGVLLALWALVGVLILSSGVGVSVPLTATGGFTLSADYLAGTNQSATPAMSGETPVFEFRVREARADDLWVNKTMDATDLGLSGEFRIAINARRAYITDTRFKSNNIRADRAEFRGLVLDEDYPENNRLDERLTIYAGPNPQSATSTDALLEIQGSQVGALNLSDGERPAIVFPRGVTIHAASLHAEQVDIQGAQILVLYESGGFDQ